MEVYPAGLGTEAGVAGMPAYKPIAEGMNPIFCVIDGFRAGVPGIHFAPVGLSLAAAATTNVVLWIACDRLVARLEAVTLDQDDVRPTRPHI